MGHSFINSNRISFFPFIFIKDLVFVSGILYLYFLQTHLGISSLSHPDNALEACSLLTPLHIVPEWYFLCQYAMLKAVPNKNAGFIILLTSILSLFLFGEIRNLSTFIKFMDCKNGFSITFFFLLSVCILWIGAQFPQEIYLSYARILTLHYYCSLFICILLTYIYFDKEVVVCQEQEKCQLYLFTQRPYHLIFKQQEIRDCLFLFNL